MIVQNNDLMAQAHHLSSHFAQIMLKITQIFVWHNSSIRKKVRAIKRVIKVKIEPAEHMISVSVRLVHCKRRLMRMHQMAHAISTVDRVTYGKI